VARSKKKIMLPKGTLASGAKWEGTRGSYLTPIPVVTEEFEEVEVVPIKEPFT
jgi:hypothetical protein